MKTFIKILVSSAVVLLQSVVLHAQNNPTPFNLSASGNYSFSSWAASSPTGTYPGNMIFHLMNTTNPTLSSSAQSDLLPGYSYGNTSGTRIQGLGTGGVLIQNATTPANTGYTANKLGETVLGLVTSTRTNIQISWKAQTRTSAGNVSAIRCQYRIGSAGAYSDFPVISEYMSSSTVGDSSVFTINFPVSLENQSLVQIRWIYYKVSGASSSSRAIRLDDISVTSIPQVTLSQHPDVCINAAAFAITDGSPSGGVYSGTGVVNGNTFDPAVSGAGTFLITYTYTDANGISNQASVNMVVSSGACVIPVGLAAVSCGATGLARNGYIYCENAAGAQDYEYEFSGGNLSAPVARRRGNWYTDFNLGWVTALSYGQTYNVRVRAKIANTWGVFANTCTISITSTIPVPELTAGSCGATGLSLSSYIYTTATPSAQDYEYRFVNTVSGAVSTRMRGNGYTDFNLSWASGVQYGNSYNVSIRAKTNGVWGPFGTVCMVTLQGFPLTQLTTASCGATGLLSTDRIFCNSVSAATNYRYRFTSVSSGTVIVRNRNSSATDLPLSFVSGLQASTTYDVEVAAYAGGVWGNYGTVCQISTGSGFIAMEPLAENYTERSAEDNLNPAQPVVMYPNPVTDNVLRLNISNDGRYNPASVIEVYDMSGRLVLAEQVVLSEGTIVIEINLANLESGAYLVRFSSGEEVYDQQTVIKK